MHQSALAPTGRFDFAVVAVCCVGALSIVIVLSGAATSLGFHACASCLQGFIYSNNERCQMTVISTVPNAIFLLKYTWFNVSTGDYFTVFDSDSSAADPIYNSVLTGFSLPADVLVRPASRNISLSFFSDAALVSTGVGLTVTLRPPPGACLLSFSVLLCYFVIRFLSLGRPLVRFV
jgi:hypothetical protein